MAGPFDVPAGVFAFDDAGVGPWSSLRQDPAGQLGNGVGPEPADAITGLRGKCALLGGGGAGDAQCGGEGDPVGIPAGMLGGLDLVADGVVIAEVSVDLLEHQVRGLRAQHRPGSALVGLEFVEGRPDLTAMGVGAGELGRGGLIWVQNRRQQPVGAGGRPAVLHGVLDHSDLGGVGSFAVGLGVEDLRHEGPVARLGSELVP